MHMNEDEQRAVDAIRLLQAAVEEVMAEKGLEDEADVVGIPIAPRRGNLSSTRYDSAIEELLEVGAMARDAETDEVNELLSSVPGAPEAFKITSGGLELLRRAREMGV